MGKKEKYIKLDKKKVKEIAEIKGVSTVTVYAALKFNTDSSLAMLIRSWALNNGGKLFEEISDPTTVKILNPKGEVVKAVVINDATTL